MKKKVKLSIENVALSILECNILKLMVKEDITINQKELIRRTNSTYGGISKALRRLENKGLIFTIKDSICFYGLNPYRKKEVIKFITGYELGKNKPLVLSGHAFVYQAEINDLPDRLIKRLEKDNAFLGYCPSGWKNAFRVFLPDGTFKLHKTKNSCRIIAYFRTFGFNPHTIEQINNEKFLRLKSELEKGYLGLKIGNPEQIANCPWQEYAIQKDHVAVAGVALGIKHNKIEQSYNYPEWEEKGFNAREKIMKIIERREQEIKELEIPQFKEEPKLDTAQSQSEKTNQTAENNEESV